MATFGMAPVLQVWGGGVPDAYASHYPDAKILVRPGSVPGGAMPGGDVSDVLHPEDSNYRKIGALFVKVAREGYLLRQHLCNPDPVSGRLWGVFMHNAVWSRYGMADVGGEDDAQAGEAFTGLGHYYDGGTWFDEGNTQYLNTSYVRQVSTLFYSQDFLQSKQRVPLLHCLSLF